MAQPNNIDGRRLTTAEILIGILAGAAGLVCWGAVLLMRSKPGAWDGKQIALAVVALVLAAVSAYIWAAPLSEAVGPAEGGKSRMQYAGGLGGLLFALGVLLLLFVQKVGEQPFQKAEWVLLVLALVGLGACVAVWWQTIVQSCTSRGALLQLNAGVVTVLVLGIVFVANYWIIPRRLGYLKYDATTAKYYSLSSQTTNLVRGIKKADAIEIVALVPGSSYSNGADRHVVLKRLEDYGALSPYLTSKVLDPYIDSEGNELFEKHVVSALPGVIVRRKDNPEVREGVTGTEEADITKAIMKVLQPSSRKIYFLSGAGEMDLAASGQFGLNELKTRLTNDRYECETLEMLKQPAIPTDAACVVSVGATMPYSTEVLTKLETYLNSGGRLLSFMDAGGKGNLGSLLSKYGIDWHPELVIDPAMTAVQDGDIFFTIDFADHDVTKLFKGTRRYAALCFKTGYFKTASNAGDYQVTELLKSSSASYAQKGKDGPRTNGPLALAIASTTKDATPPADDKKDEKTPPEPDKKRIRVVAFGDSKFGTDIVASQPSVVNVHVVASAVAWLTDSTQVSGIAPKNPSKDAQSRPITIDAKGRRWVVLLTLVLPLLLLLGAGITVRVVRR